MLKGIIWLSSSLKREAIFILMALAVILPTIFNISMPVQPTPLVEKGVDYFNQFPAGTTMLFSIDYGPSTAAEVEPIAAAFLHQAMEQDYKVVFMALYPEGQQLTDVLTRRIMPHFPDKKKGVDYVNLGYKAGGQPTLVGICSNFTKFFPVDTEGTPYASIPVLRSIKSVQDFDMVCSFSSGKPGGREHVLVTSTQFGLPLMVGCTAVTAPEYQPYVKSGQLVALIPGLRGGAEVEQLLELEHRPASQGMFAQTTSHLLLIGLILLGNIGYFLNQRLQQGGGHNGD